MNLYLSLNYYETPPPPKVLMNEGHIDVYSWLNVSLILRSLRAAFVYNSERGPGETRS